MNRKCSAQSFGLKELRCGGKSRKCVIEKNRKGEPNCLFVACAGNSMFCPLVQ